jgi:hypothetical protein
MEETRPRGIGNGLLLGLAGALLVVAAAGFFLPIRPCYCIENNLRGGGWRCPSCNNTGKVSLYELWRSSHSRSIPY